MLDASAVLELLLKTTVAADVQKILGRDQTLHAPHLLDVEVAQVLRRYTGSGALPAERARVALEDLSKLGIHRYPHEPLMWRVWELRTNLTAYDACYVALAEALDARLVTFDARLSSAPGHAARVELLQ